MWALLAEYLKKKIKFCYITWQEMECCYVTINDTLYLNDSLNYFKLLFQSSFEPFFKASSLYLMGCGLRKADIAIPVLKMETLRLKKIQCLPQSHSLLSCRLRLQPNSLISMPVLKDKRRWWMQSPKYSVEYTVTLDALESWWLCLFQ